MEAVDLATQQMRKTREEACTSSLSVGEDGHSYKPLLVEENTKRPTTQERKTPTSVRRGITLSQMLRFAHGGYEAKTLFP